MTDPLTRNMTTVQRGAIFRANGNVHLIKMSSYTYLPYE